MERNREKRYVAVDVHFSAEGRLRPLQIVFDEERVYAVDQVRDVCRRAADVGGVGDRYTCVIQGQERLRKGDGSWKRSASESVAYEGEMVRVEDEIGRMLWLCVGAGICYY